MNTKKSKSIAGHELQYGLPYQFIKNNIDTPIFLITCKTFFLKTEAHNKTSIFH